MMLIINIEKTFERIILFSPLCYMQKTALQPRTNNELPGPFPIS